MKADNAHNRKTKYLAFISLTVMACGFAITLLLPRTPVFQILQGGFEAGLVGGLADWFAVTALFRHPMGIPIPHTALLPQNRKRLIGALVKVLENDWLTKESIKNKLSQFNFLEKLIAALEKELYSDSLKKWIVSELNPFILSIDTESLIPPIEKEIKAYIKAADVKPLLLAVKAYAWENRLPQNIFGFVASEAEKWAERDQTKQIVGAAAMKMLKGIETDGLLRLALSGFRMLLTEDMLGGLLQPFIQNKLKELGNDDNEIRLMILNELSGGITNIIESDQLMGVINNWKNETAENFPMFGIISEILNTQKIRLAAMLQDEETIEQAVFPYIRNFLDSILSSPEKTEQIETRIHRAIYDIVDANHSKIGKLVKENLDRLDDKTLVNMMENNIGGDLQWIRVNGAVCGFLIGIGLTLVKMVL